MKHGDIECGVGIDELRAAVNVANNTSEDFNCRFTAEQLILILRGYRASGYDYTADQWTQAYLDAALAGKPPKDVDPTTYAAEPPPNTWPCANCEKTFRSRAALIRHQELEAEDTAP